MAGKPMNAACSTNMATTCTARNTCGPDYPDVLDLHSCVTQFGKRACDLAPRTCKAAPSPHSARPTVPQLLTVSKGASLLCRWPWILAVERRSLAKEPAAACCSAFEHQCEATQGRCAAHSNQHAHQHGCEDSYGA